MWITTGTLLIIFLSGFFAWREEHEKVQSLTLDNAFADGILIGQQMSHSLLMPTQAGKDAALVECRKLVREAEAKGLGKTLSVLDKYREEETHVQNPNLPTP